MAAAALECSYLKGRNWLFGRTICAYTPNVLIGEIGAFAEGTHTEDRPTAWSEPAAYSLRILYALSCRRRRRRRPERMYPPLVATTGAPATADAQPLINSDSGESPAASASTTRYLASADRVLGMTDVGWKLCVGLVVLIVIAWAIGVLPGAVRLF